MRVFQIPVFLDFDTEGMIPRLSIDAFETTKSTQSLRSIEKCELKDVTNAG